MFKNRALQVKMVKTEDVDMTPGIEIPHVDPEVIGKIATEYTLKVIGAVGIVIGANRVLKTVCDIAVVAAKAKLK